MHRVTSQLGVDPVDLTSSQHAIIETNLRSPPPGLNPGATILHQSKMSYLALLATWILSLIQT